MTCRQTEAVRESNDFSEYSEMSLERTSTRFRRLLHPDEEAENLKLGTHVSTTLPYMELLHCPIWRCTKTLLVDSMGEIASDYRAEPVR